MELSADHGEFQYCVEGKLVSSTVAEAARTALQVIQGETKNDD